MKISVRILAQPEITSFAYYTLLQDHLATLQRCLTLIQITSTRAQQYYNLHGLTDQEYHDHMEAITQCLTEVQTQDLSIEELEVLIKDLQQLEHEMTKLVITRTDRVITETLLASYEGDTPQ